MSISIAGKRTDTATPCKGICSTTNLGDAVCVGCGRTDVEVINWNRYTIEEKRAIIARIKGKPSTSIDMTRCIK